MECRLGFLAVARCCCFRCEDKDGAKRSAITGMFLPDAGAVYVSFILSMQINDSFIPKSASTQPLSLAVTLDTLRSSLY